MHNLCGSTRSSVVTCALAGEGEGEAFAVLLHESVDTSSAAVREICACAPGAVAEFVALLYFKEIAYTTVEREKRKEARVSLCTARKNVQWAAWHTATKVAHSSGVVRRHLIT